MYEVEYYLDYLNKKIFMNYLKQFDCLDENKEMNIILTILIQFTEL